MSAGRDDYLARFAVELRKHGIADPLILEEAGAHLADAVDDGVRRGLPPAQAEEEALARFGVPAVLAASFAAERFLMRNGILLCAAVVFGVAIAYVDSRPGWDATGITAFSMLIVAGVLGFIGPRRPWLWAIGVGAWIPLYAILKRPSAGAVAMLIVLLFPLAGAYAGMAMRHMLDRLAPQRR